MNGMSLKRKAGQNGHKRPNALKETRHSDEEAVGAKKPLLGTHSARVEEARRKKLAQIAAAYVGLAHSRLQAESPGSATFPHLDSWLRAFFKANAQFGSQDRRWYADHLFRFMRWLPFLIQNSALADAPKNPLHSSRHSQSIGACPEQFLASPLAQSSLSDLCSAYWDLDEKNAAALLHLTLPPAFVDAFARRCLKSLWSPEQAHSFLDIMLTKNVVWLRLKGSPYWQAVRDELCHLVANGGLDDWGHVQIPFESQPPAPPAVWLSGRVSLFDCAFYKKGLVEVQDFASQCLGYHMPLKKGLRIWDCCAGGGGKTVQLASRLENSGLIYASDIREHKLKEIRKRAARSALFNIETCVWDASKGALNGVQNLDGAIIDAPCSGSGTWRRNPDLKLRPLALNELNRIQQQILKEASTCIKPGGYLTYATCSWLVEENEDIVDDFMNGEQGQNWERREQRLWGPWVQNGSAPASDVTFSAVLRRKW